MCDKVSLEKKIEKVGKKLNNKDYSHLISKDLILVGLRAVKFANIISKED
ncbi:TPA: hypothetical protein I9080_000008 [Clostridium perfringens]|uniref:Uncharacterized protein n=1 Tax=Clostridium perfringens TaxID=1502 RepID=A0A8H9QU99_CLOPF|nr:hypothetical protein [Clostridium perfringens]